jgi:hypothetical protein
MRIAYLAVENAASESGVLKKMRDQVIAWTDAGHEVRLFIYSFQDGVWNGIRSIPHTVVPMGGRICRRINFIKVISAVSTWKPDCVYMRSMIYDIFLELLKKIPTVIEVNSDDITEFMNFKKYFYVYHIMTRDILLRRCRGIVSTSGQVAESLSVFQKPIVVIGNSIDLHRIPALPLIESHQTRLVFVGGENSRWHGVDKLVDLANAYPEWIIDVVGYRRSGVADKLLPNMIMHGFLNHKDYVEILKQADVAIGSMAMHRIRLNDGSTLKVREYLAYGLPVIIGYQDVDFPEGSDFILELPNTPNNVARSLDRIKAFVDAWRGKRVPRERVLHLDTKIKEKKRLDFIAEVRGRC